MENSLIFRILKFGMENEMFTKDDIFEEVGGLSSTYFEAICGSSLHKSPGVIFYMYGKYVNSEKDGDERIQVNHPKQPYKSKGTLYQITPDAAAKYVEMVELQEARKAATEANNRALEAKKLAWGSILVAILLGVVSLFVQQCTVQEVKVINQQDLQYHKHSNPTGYQKTGGNKSTLELPNNHRVKASQPIKGGEEIKKQVIKTPKE